MAKWSEKTQAVENHAGPPRLTLATPAAKNTTAIVSHTARTGQRYSPLRPGGGLPRRRRSTASTDHASPHHDSARIPSANRISAVMWSVLPKLYGSATRYAPSTNAIDMLWRVNSPMQAKSSDTFHVGTSTASTRSDRNGRCSRSKIQIGSRQLNGTEPHPTCETGR